MEDVKKWSVTYTKHVKQKRKVYQDGSLALHTSSSKVMLYDDSEKLLECRVLKNDEVVSSGQTLAFNDYLVDVGEAEGGNKPLHELNSRGQAKKVTQKTFPLHRNKFDNRAVEKSKVEKDKAQMITLSPSQKIMREFKKVEMQKYGTLSSSPDSKTPDTADWHVLYTTHLTQKSKKYHDGFLRCTNSGSFNRQVFLYDMSWKFLDSKFLKKAEEIRPGEMMEFHGYLVEVGDCKEKHGSSKDSNTGKSRCNSLQQFDTQKPKKYLSTIKSEVKGEENSSLHQCGPWESNLYGGKLSMAEWQVLYTSQLTQKAKKYHDGFLKIAICGSLGRQVMLYDASRKILETRFLKKDEVIRTGTSMVFDAHLVDIGEQAVEEKGQMDFSYLESLHTRQKAKGLELKSVKVDESAHGVLSQKHGGKHPEKTCPAKNLNSHCAAPGAGNTDYIRRGPTDKALRDACQILSILRRPSTQADVLVDDKPERKETLASISKELQHSDCLVLDSDNGGRQLASTNNPTEFVETECLTDSSGTEKLPGPEKAKESVSDCCRSQVKSGSEIGDIHSLPGLHVQADSKCCDDTTFTSGASFSCDSLANADEIRKNSEEVESPAKIKDESPSFDLGL